MEPNLSNLELKCAVWTLGKPNFSENQLETKGGTLTPKQAPKTKVALKKAILETLPGTPVQSRDPRVKGNYPLGLPSNPLYPL